MTRTADSPLFESVRRWVLRTLPVDQTDTALVAHLDAKDAHGLLVVYHNWQSRLISDDPRTVHRSEALGMNPLADQYPEALAAIIADIAAGNSLTKYLSRGVKIAAAVPGDTPALQRRRDLDLMLNDWGIHHLHLSTFVEEDGFVTRTGPLLFAVFRRENAYLIDIMEHGSWAKQHLLEVLVREFPDSGGFNILRGVVGLSYEPDEDERRVLRNNAVNSPIMIDGKAIMPAAGMTTAGTTMAATLGSDRLLDAIERFEQSWATQEQQVRDLAHSQGVQLPEQPDFAFDIRDSGPGIFERKSGAFFDLAQ